MARGFEVWGDDGVRGGLNPQPSGSVLGSQLGQGGHIRHSLGWRVSDLVFRASGACASRRLAANQEQPEVPQDRQPARTRVACQP